MQGRRTVRWFVPLGTGALVIASALTIEAWVSLGHVWPASPVPYQVNPFNNDVSEAAADAAIRQGADAWSTVTPSFAFSYGGRTSTSTLANDGQNVVLFRNSSQGSTIAETLMTWDAAGALVDTDIVFYDGGFTFFTGTSGCSSGFYIEDIATHELGHALGLGHSTVAGATMQASVPDCSKDPRSLEADDIAGVTALYPPQPGTRASDFDGDRQADPTVFRNGTWYELRSTVNGGYGVAWGIKGDVPAPGDYDGDGIADPTVFRPSAGTWYILPSATGTGVGVQWGVTGDVPVAADYDGDRKTDVAVFRPSTGVWYIVPSTTNTAVGVPWGIAGDVPVPADYDGDGRADPTVFRAATGTWYELRSTTGTGFGVVWGLVNDIPLAADYDGDGKADPTVFRSSGGTWYELRSRTGGWAVVWGAPGDTPLAGDYDGDGRADPTVYRSSTNAWYQLRSRSGTGYGVVWGLAGDVPQ